MNENKKGFTLIELLIIVATIGLLVSAILVTINIARVRAKDSSFKSTIHSIQTGLISCCYTNGSAVLGNTVGLPICEGSEKYPGSESIGSISAGDCFFGGSFSKIITPGTKNSGNCHHAVITNNSITYCIDDTCSGPC